VVAVVASIVRETAKVVTAVQVVSVEVVVVVV